jgi:hypothetical protein
MTRITANMTAYSAISCAWSSDQSLRKTFFIFYAPCTGSTGRRSPPGAVQFYAHFSFCAQMTCFFRIKGLRGGKN